VRRITSCTLVLLAVAAVAAPLAASRPDGSDWTTHRAGALRISAPATWIDVTRLTPQVLAKARRLPALKTYVTVVQQSKAVKLLLADVGPLTVTSHFVTNLNVTQVPTIGDLRLQHDAALAELRSSGIAAGPVHAAYEQLPAGKALELRYHANVGAGHPILSYLQFMFVRGGRATVVTYTTLPALEAKELPLFRRSIRSFRVG
jgi:hypothetical protein